MASAPLSPRQLQRVVLGSILLPALLFASMAALVLLEAYGVLQRDGDIVRSDRLLASCYRAQLACVASNSTELPQELMPRLREMEPLAFDDPEQEDHLHRMQSLLASAPQQPSEMLQGLQAISAQAQSRRVEQAIALQRKLMALVFGCAFVAVVPMVLIAWWERRHLHRVVTSYNQVVNGLQAAAERNRSLAQGLQTAQERERGRIARELHDDLGQIFTSYKMDLNWLRRQDGLEVALTSRIDEMLALNEAAVQSVRRIVNELRPAILDDLGLLDALDWLVQDAAARGALTVRTRLPSEVSLSSELETTLFRIVQEGLTNILKHAGAERPLVVTLQLKLDARSVWLRLADNGKGMQGAPSDALSRGQLGVRERAEILGGWAGYRNRRHGRGAVLLAILPREGVSCKF